MHDNTYVQSFHTISVFCDEHHFIIARIQSISSSFIICRKRQSQSKMCTKWNRLSHRSQPRLVRCGEIWLYSNGFSQSMAHKYKFVLSIQVLQVLQCSKSHSLAPGFEAFLLCERSRVLQTFFDRAAPRRVPLEVRPQSGGRPYQSDRGPYQLR